jgi:hypothetical protein
MLIARVAKYIGPRTPTNPFHHVGHHGAQPCPWHHLTGIDIWKARVDPLNQWLNAVCPNVKIDAIKFCSSCRTNAIITSALMMKSR